MLGLLGLTSSIPLLAQGADLHLTPTLCAIGEGEEICSISVSVTLSVDDGERYCLSIADRGLIECFPGDVMREIEVYVTADADVQFQVTRADSGDQVAMAILKIAKYRPKRHQRRYGWGLL